ncbi:MAG: tripartite tricarboxylate transporter TctB family protein [Deltaproteobacteria bacterium]
MKKLQLISGIIIMVFAALICLETSKLSFGTIRTPGPGFLPFGYGALLFFLATIFVLKSGFKAGAFSDSASALWSGLKWKRIPYTLAVLLVYALLLDRLGYLVCTGILMVYLFWEKGMRKGSIAIITGIGVSIITYFVFKKLLSVQLPSGYLGF